jgi:hypothetical protein
MQRKNSNSNTEPINQLTFSKIQAKESSMKTAIIILAGLAATSLVMANDFLKPNQIQSLLVGKKVVAQIGNGPMLDFQMNADLTTTTSAAGGDVGKWRLSDDGYCITWKKIRAGNERCFKVSKMGFGYFIINPDGSQVRIVRID